MSKAVIWGFAVALYSVLVGYLIVRVYQYAKGKHMIRQVQMLIACTVTKAYGDGYWTRSTEVGIVVFRYEQFLTEIYHPWMRDYRFIMETASSQDGMLDTIKDLMTTNGYKLYFDTADQALGQLKKA